MKWILSIFFKINWLITVYQNSLPSTVTPFYSKVNFSCEINNQNVNPIQEGGGGKKANPTNFSPVTSTNVGISPQNFLTFSFNPFATLV